MTATETIPDMETQQWLAGIRVMPHNLDEKGNTTILPYRTFRVGRLFFAWDIAKVSFVQIHFNYDN